MTSKELGLIEKYIVERVDGKLVRWCFVLEDTDPLAVPALQAYADAAEAAGYVALASDLRVEADRIPLPRSSPRPCCHCDGTGRERDGDTCTDCNGTCCSQHYKGVNPSCGTCRIA